MKFSSAQTWQGVLSPLTGAGHTAKTKPDRNYMYCIPFVTQRACHILNTQPRQAPSLCAYISSSVNMLSSVVSTNMVIT